MHPGRNGYLWLLERRADGIGFVDAEPYVHQNVFTAIDPRTGRPSYDPARVPGIGRSAVFCPSHHGAKNWPPAAFNPTTGLLYIPANENLCTSMSGYEVEYTPGRQFVGARLEVLIRDGAHGRVLIGRGSRDAKGSTKKRGVGGDGNLDPRRDSQAP